MPKVLKEELRPMIEKQAKDLGVENFYDMIADDETASTEEEVIIYLPPWPKLPT